MNKNIFTPCNQNNTFTLQCTNGLACLGSFRVLLLKTAPDLLLLSFNLRATLNMKEWRCMKSHLLNIS